MAFTIYAKMKRVGKQKKEDLLPVPFELEKRPDTVRELVTALVRQIGRASCRERV